VSEVDPNQSCNIILNPTLNATLYQSQQAWYFEWLKDWGPILLSFAQLLAALALALLTYHLWKSTSAYAQQVKKQTEIMSAKQKQDISILRYHRLREEMDKLLAPLYFATFTAKDIDGNDAGLFGPIDNIPERIKFWDNIRSNIYLSRSENLHKNLIEHLALSEALQTPAAKTPNIRYKFDQNAKKIVEEVQKGYQILRKQIAEVEKELDIPTVFLETNGPFMLTEYGKSANAILWK
jgi:hypothetical protein